MPDEAERNPIELVRERLDGGRKWHKGSMEAGGNVCIVGAIVEIPYDGNRLRVSDCIEQVAIENYRDRISTESLMTPHKISTADFNDHPDTTWADVEMVLDKASVAWDEQAATR